MATDTKNESASQEVSPNIAVGDGGKRHIKLSYKQELKRLAKQAALLVIFLIILAVLGVLIRDYSHRNVAFRIDGKNYSKASIKEMADFASKQDGQSKKDAAKGIYSLYKMQIAAQKAGITPNADELQAAAKSIKMPIAKTAAQKQYVNLLIFNEALSQTYIRYQQGGYEGLYFIFDFSRRILPPAAGLKPLAGYGNQTLIQQDKQYAHQQAQQFYNRYKQSPATVDTLDAQLKAMDKTHSSGGVTKFGSSTTIDLHSQIYYPGIYDYVVSQTKPGLSGILTGKVETSLNPSSSDYADGYYYFADIKRAGHIISNPQGNINKEEQKLKAAYYGI